MRNLLITMGLATALLNGCCVVERTTHEYGIDNREPGMESGDYISDPHPGLPCFDGCDHHYHAGRWFRSNHRHYSHRCGDAYDRGLKNGVWTLH